MSRKYAVLALIVVILNLVFASWMVLHNDVHFKSDVARDFLLYQEISQKKFVMLGPRASGAVGVYHGPAWLYLTYPAYVFGSGNPVVMGWYWIGLIILGLISSFLVAAKLFSQKAAWIFVVFISGFFIVEAKELINPYGAFFIVPLYYYFLVRYMETLRVKYLGIHIILAGLIIQFQMAIGVPLTLLSAALVIYIIITRKKYLHFLAFPLILLPLSTFVIFELRHTFAQTQALLTAKVGSSEAVYDLLAMLNQRAKLAFGDSLFIFRLSFSKLAWIPTLLAGWFFVKIFKHLPKLEKQRYWLFAYLYFGSWLMTLVVPGMLLTHQWLPLTALGMLFFASLVKYFDRRIFSILLLLVVLQYSFLWGREVILQSQDSGQRFDSWKFQKRVTDLIVADGETEFGYFAYAPDIYAYGPKYSLSYMKQQHPELQIYPFEKKHVTYVMSEPVPVGRKDLSPREWIKTQFGIYATPVFTYTFPNGYKLEKYVLSDEEQAVPISSSLDTGVFFR